MRCGNYKIDLTSDFLLQTMLLLWAAVLLTGCAGLFSEQNRPDPAGKQQPALTTIEHVLLAIERGQYDPQVDLNQDGVIDLNDLDLAMEDYEQKQHWSQPGTNPLE